MHSFTQALVPWALPGIVLVSALGALVMCVLVFRYGFPFAEPDSRSPRGSSRDAVLITGAGHAIAGACFAIAALLAVVVLAQSARSPSPPEPSAIPNVVAGDELDALRRAIADAEARLARAESGLSAAGAEADAGLMRVEDLEARILAAEKSLHRVSEESSRALAATKQLDAGIPPRRAAAVAPSRPAATTPSAPRAAAPAPTPSAPHVAAPAPSPPRAAQPGPAVSPPRAVPPGPALSPPQAVPPAPAPAEPARPSLEVARPAPDAASSPRPIDRTPDTNQKTARSVTTEPRSPAPDPEPDLGTKIREDWELIKRESRDAFRRLRETLR